MVGPSPIVEHLLRRAGFGISPDEARSFSGLGYLAAVDALVEFDPAGTDIDNTIGTPGHVGITTRGVFSPNTVINDSRQRWLFRMVHSPAPLQEKMTLFWHHHFATAYSKLSGIVGATDGARMMAAKPSEDPGRAKGQIELFRQYALGNFHSMLVDVAKDIAMLYWLDGRLNTKNAPQENFGREIMELFTFGVENYVEADVYAAARAFTGWTIVRTGDTSTPAAYWAFSYNANNHETTAKDFSFPVSTTGSKRIDARSAANGMQDGLDLIRALAYHPETARRLARRLWTWFVSETAEPEASFVDTISTVYLQNNTEMKPVIRAVLLSPQFVDQQHRFERYSWPVEFVVRSLKEMGYIGFSVDSAMTPLINMGQQLFEPPDVSGWETGTGWFSTGRMLARMNFASVLATNQRFALRDLSRPYKATPESIVNWAVDSLNLPPLAANEYLALTDYVRSGGTWTGSDAQLLNKAGGLFHLLTGAGDYQLI